MKIFIALLFCFSLAHGAPSHPRSVGCFPIACLMNPCELWACSDHPNATCRPDYCHGCLAHFYEEGHLITDCKVAISSTLG